MGVDVLVLMHELEFSIFSVVKLHFAGLVTFFGFLWIAFFLKVVNLAN